MKIKGHATEPVLSELRIWEEKQEKIRLENTTGPKIMKGLAISD